MCVVVLALKHERIAFSRTSRIVHIVFNLEERLLAFIHNNLLNMVCSLKIKSIALLYLSDLILYLSWLLRLASRIKWLLSHCKD